MKTSIETSKMMGFRYPPRTIEEVAPSSFQSLHLLVIFSTTVAWSHLKTRGPSQRRGKKIHGTYPAWETYKKLWKITVFNRKTHYKWVIFNCKLLVHQRVTHWKKWWFNKHGLVLGEIQPQESIDYSIDIYSLNVRFFLFSNDLQEIMDVTIQIWRYILLGCFTEKHFHNLQLILSSLPHCPVSPRNWHLDPFVELTHPYHPSKSSKKCQKYVQKNNMGMYFHVFPISDCFLQEIVEILHGKFSAPSLRHPPWTSTWQMRTEVGIG